MNLNEKKNVVHNVHDIGLNNDYYRSKILHVLSYLFSSVVHSLLI